MFNIYAQNGFTWRW